ncbi:ectoine/hydroxyectoine ABC transporter permease subunit EhuD [Alsobacter sp. SYSU M60028]|uniref:Ectoine/hydroxyectoine ABC transporter permease subunit EhuD n=1 Tax=Alsobacter ponti TaxID=2962936 RepID=A0ABT1LHL6_9HYPH|nr:ectoine/hydroxyectoine ABC transporter permease subunit EhuD [Alsobacter ponti]MCP8940996.1 ectoine/hydroxyectoine ABC transporter permease subunit EhuD [Alsobacter ponti]
MRGALWDWAYAWSVMPDLMRGFALTVQLTLISAALALSLGFVWSVVRLAGVPLLSPLAWFAAEFFRGTPFLIQLYVVFYVLPNYGIAFSPDATGVLVLGVYGAARSVELYRAGLESLPQGQWEACLALNLPLSYVWRRAVIPQVAPVVLPMLGNLVIVMFKDSAVLSTITVLELVSRARDAGLASFRFLEPLTLAGLLYWAVSYAAARGVRRLEARGGHR